jgi:hypothetical protein
MKAGIENGLMAKKCGGIAMPECKLRDLLKLPSLPGLLLVCGSIQDSLEPRR